MLDTQLPRRLQKSVSVQQIGHETLVYDEIRHQAFCLNRTSAAIWTMCDGVRTVAAIAEAATMELETPVNKELVQLALAGLLRDGLLQPDSVATVLPDVSRRKLMRTFAGGAVAMLPMVAMVMAPTAAQAYTGCVNCTAPSVQQQQAIVEARQKAHAQQADPWHMKAE